MPELSPLLERFQPSAIAGMSTIVARMRNEGHTLYDFSMGEPDFDTPEHICAAAVEAIERGETRYAPVDGTIALREAVQRKFSRDNHLDFQIEQIVAASGAKPLLADMIRTIAAEGDEIVLAAPCWTSHIGMIRLAGARPVLVPTDPSQGFRVTPDALTNALTSKTRAVLLCAPSNPSGAVYPDEEFAAIAEVLRQHKDVWVITDDLYEHIVFDGRKFRTLIEIAPDLADRTVLVNGVSKAYAMTGWRIGYAAGPRRLMDALRKLMSQSTGCPSSISEAAAIAALDGPLDCVKAFVDVFQARRDRALRTLNQIHGLECAKPDGAFYLYPGCAGVIGSRRPDGGIIESSSDFANYLLEAWSVVTVPGNAFELDPHIRISIATADGDLDEGMASIGRAVSELDFA